MPTPSFATTAPSSREPWPATPSGEAGVDEAPNELVAFQNPGGGRRGLDGDVEAPPSTISRTWVGLKWLHWLGTPGAAPVDRTVEFLQRWR